MTGRVEPLQPGDMCGQYEIQREHARGGMAIVYRAIDSLGQRCAIKVMKPTKGFFERRAKRFEREIRALRAIIDDHVVQFFEAGKRKNIVWLAMEFFDGETLSDLIARRGGELSTAELLDIGIQLARGLSEIHKCKVIHRDLKPDNVMINASGHVKIFDFGIAKYDGSFTTTEPGTTPVTVLYMSPEQAAAEQLDARTDIFNFGLIMHELISGQHAIDGVDQSRTVNEVVAHIVRNDVRPLERDECDPALAEIIGRALEQDRERRIASAAELVTAFAELIRIERRRADAVSRALTESTERQRQARYGKLRLVHAATEPVTQRGGNGAGATVEHTGPSGDAGPNAAQGSSGHAGPLFKDTVPLEAWVRREQIGGNDAPPAIQAQAQTEPALPFEGRPQHAAAEPGTSHASAGLEELRHTQPLPLRATQAIADRSAAPRTSRRAVTHTMFMAYQRQSRRDRWLSFAAGIAICLVVLVPIVWLLNRPARSVEPDAERPAGATEQPAVPSKPAYAHEPAAAAPPASSSGLYAQQDGPAAAAGAPESRNARALPPGTAASDAAPPESRRSLHQGRTGGTAPRSAVPPSATPRSAAASGAAAPPSRSAAPRPALPQPDAYPRTDHGF